MIGKGKSFAVITLCGVVILQLLGSGLAGPALSAGDERLYIPLMMTGESRRMMWPRINMPYFSDQIAFDQTAIAWFGHLSPRDNYAEIRAGYNPSELYVYIAVFDRALWYDDTNPAPATLEQWDAVTLLLDTAGSDSLSSTSWRFVGQLYWWEEATRYRAAYRGDNGSWHPADVSFVARREWRGNAPNDDSDSDRGWAMGFRIPFQSLGRGRAPTKGTLWRMAVVVHDRDSRAGPPVGDKAWPPGASANGPAGWGWLHFGLPEHRAQGIPQGSVMIRRPSQHHPSVPDADVGGVSVNQCPGDEYYIWNQWANANYGRSADFNIQNQSDIADWPCFSKYYVTFDLDAIPRQKTIMTATLTLHQFGNAGGAGLAQPSWIQVLRAAGAWDEDTITWNTAPLALENVGGSWVDPLRDWPGWPGVPRQWDVSYAVARAYASGEPLRLILYSSDSAYHSGKYFVSSDTGDWNLAGRPRLEVWWGEQR